MSLPANEQKDQPVASTKRAAKPADAWSCRASLVVVALLMTGVLAAACGGKSPGPGVASLADSTTTTGPSTTPSAGTTSPTDRLLAYAGCMRTHGEPNMPEPTIQGNTVHLSATPGSGFDPNSPQFTAADNACKHLLVGTGGAPQGNVITPADQADYLNAAACMRSHGVPNFPDPVFENNNVTFNAPGTSIDTNSSQYKSALATCEKLIPAGLPYSSPGGS
jgi:hypothetical protein